MDDPILFSKQEEIQIKARGRFLLQIVETFIRWRGPDGRRFANQFFSELFMSKLSLAWQAEIDADAAVQKQLTDALAQNKTLTDLNAQLTDAASKPPVGTTAAVTPAGYTLDATDLQTVDAIIAKHTVPTPVAGQP